MVLRRSIAFGMVMSPPCFYLLSTPAVSSQHTTHNTQHAMHSTAQHIVAQCKTQRSTAQRNATLSETQRIVLSILYMMCFFADGSDHATSVPMPLFLQADGGDRTFSFFIGSVLLAGSLGAKNSQRKDETTRRNAARFRCV
jgi:hypothetical protein